MKYELEARLGAGRTGEVFRARLHGAAGFARVLAMKRIDRGLEAGGDLPRRLVAAAHVAASLRHPNIVAVSDFGRDETDAFYLAMELVDGADLAELLPRLEVYTGGLPPSDATYVAGEVLRALAHAHAHQVVHGDLDARHILVDRRGAVKLGGFFRLDRDALEDRRVDLRALRGLLAAWLPEPPVDVDAWLAHDFPSAEAALAALVELPTYPADGAAELARLVEAVRPPPRRRAQATTLGSATGVTTVREPSGRGHPVVAFVVAATLGAAVGFLSPPDAEDVAGARPPPVDAGLDATAIGSR